MTAALAGITVLDLSKLLPGPYCSMLLADLGARVIKVEPPGTGDTARRIDGMYSAVNRGKESICLNLKQPAARRVFYRLAEQADVVLEGFRPGVTERLQVDYRTLSPGNPRLIYCSLSGYGQDGPYRLKPGHDCNYLGIAGMLGLNGDPASVPTRPLLPISDLAGAMFAFSSILGALYVRERTGAGQYIDVALADTMLSWVGLRLGPFFERGALPALSPNPPGNRPYLCADGKCLTVGAVEEHFWAKLFAALGRPELAAGRYGTAASRQEHGQELDAWLEAAFRQRSRAEWLALLEEHDVPCGPVNLPAELPENPHFRARGMFAAAGGRLQVAHPVRFSATPAQLGPPPPALGQHTESILAELGLDGGAVAELRESGAI